jgi:hypothetical protein
MARQFAAYRARIFFLVKAAPAGRFSLAGMPEARENRVVLLRGEEKSLGQGGTQKHHRGAAPDPDEETRYEDRPGSGALVLGGAVLTGAG